MTEKPRLSTIRVTDMTFEQFQEFCRNLGIPPTPPEGLPELRARFEELRAELAKRHPPP
jgi:hypothetical protein